MYRRAAPFQAALAVTGSVAGLVAWATGSGWLWLIGALLLGSVIPFTFRASTPTNHRLMDPRLDVSAVQASELLAR
ncbi:MAG: anthrone oxygenase family protein [Candidatus Binatia bacterium]